MTNNEYIQEVGSASSEAPLLPAGTFRPVATCDPQLPAKKTMREPRLPAKKTMYSRNVLQEAAKKFGL